MELLGDTPFTVRGFADDVRPVSLDGGGVIGDLPCQQTVFTPPPADAVLLLSDGRFSAPQDSEPIYAVLDPSLENATDAAICDIHVEGDQVSISVANNGPPRTLTLRGVVGTATEAVAGNQTLMRTIQPAAQAVWAKLSGGDLWPENDSISIRLAPPAGSESWWISSAGSAPQGWRDNAG